MSLTRTLIVATVVAVALPSGVAFAQMSNGSMGASTGPAAGQPSDPYVPSPMQEQAMAPGRNMAPTSDTCGSPRVATMTDEFGHKYNCRGDRIR